MMSPGEIRQWAQRRYSEWLCSVVTGDPFFPREVRFGRPSTTSDFDSLKADFEALAKGAGQIGYLIAWESRATKRWGVQQFPSRVWFEDEHGFLRAIGKASDAIAFRRNLAATQERCPDLVPWLSRYALRMAEAADDWPDVLTVAEYFLRCPKPNLYARQLPISVPTKFIDQHHDLLRPILDSLVAECVNANAATFNTRFHLLEDEPHVRLRFLDDAFMQQCGLPVADLTIPISVFRSLRIAPSVTVVVENKMCFLTLPRLANALAVCGQGKAASLLHGTPWLRSCRLVYWGDMDDSGFGILSSLRKEYPHTESILMDDHAWLQNEHLSHDGKMDSSALSLHTLTRSEAAAWEIARSRTLMIEQEQIPQPFVVAALTKLLTSQFIAPPQPSMAHE